MEHVYAVSNSAQLKRYHDFVTNVQPVLDQYIAHIQEKFQTTSLPRAILWTDERIATELLSDIPVPAYTNDYRIVMCPDLDTWQKIYLKQIEGIAGDTSCEISSYYLHSLNQHHVLQILGHELAHHSELFIDDAYDSGEGIWFEEGMVEYISRRFFLTEEEFTREAQINRLLVDFYIERHGNHPLDLFGTSTYQNSIADIFFEYWRSFLAVSHIVDQYDGDLQAVFASYHRWYQTKCGQSLEHWFKLNPKSPI